MVVVLWAIPGVGFRAVKFLLGNTLARNGKEEDFSANAA
jgi:hypothetical protein